MATKLLLLLVSLLASGLCSNRSRYKIVLRQQGYTQFIQYDVATPPLRELTLCLWMKLYHDQGPQSILTYLAKGNNRIVKIWLDEGARYLMLTIKGYAMPKVPINLSLNNWNHICFSYQSEYGAYALYLNGDLLQCEANEKLIGYALPPGGSIIIGYGITLDGKPTGLSGEIYGVNMIVASTITVNNTSYPDTSIDQRHNYKNLSANHNTNMKYVILNELNDNETDILFQQSKTSQTDSVKKLHNQKHLQDFFDSQESNDLKLSKTFLKLNKEVMKKKENFKQNTKNFHPILIKGSLQSSSEKSNFRSIDITSFPEASLGLVQYEVPPPLPALPRTTKKPSGFHKNDNSFRHQLSNNIEYPSTHIFPPAQQPNIQISKLDEPKIFNFPVTNMELNTNTLAQHVVPPPRLPDPFTAHNKIQHIKTSKPTQKKSMKKKSTTGVKHNSSDSHPKEILEYEVPPPPTTDTNVYGQWTAFTHNGKISDFLKNMKYDYRKVPPTIPLITVSETFPYPLYKMPTPLMSSNINRRVFNKREAIRPEINVKILDAHDIKTTILNEHSKIEVKNVNITHRGESQYKGKENHTIKDIKYDYFDNYDDETFIRESPLFVELPFIKALEYYESKLQPRNNSINSDTYQAQTAKQDITSEKNQELKTDVDTENPWSTPKGNTKYVFKQKITEAEANQIDSNANTNQHEKSFHRPVKIGNALNERFVIGKNAEQKKRSFEGGDELVPELNRYRSDIDKVYDKIPNSLMPRICRNIDMLELSTKNVERHKYSTASEFILQSLIYDFQDDSKYEYDYIFFIRWHQTPVRLFGGATPLKEPDICTIIKCETNTERIQ